MAPRSPLLVLRARETVRLAPGDYLTKGESLTVTEGNDIAGLICDMHPDAQLQRFGRVLFDIVSEPTDADEEDVEPYAPAHVPAPAHVALPQRAEDEPHPRPHLYVVRDDQES